MYHKSINFLTQAICNTYPRMLQAAVFRRESVAEGEVASVGTGFEPAAALCRRAVVERVGNGVAAGFLLKVVVANLTGCFETLVDVAVFKTAENAVVVICPNAGVEVGLQFETYAEPIAFLFTHGSHLLVHAVEVAKQVLYVVSHLMGYYVSLGEIAVGSYLPFHVHEKREVYIHRLVGRAIEWTCA